jgi:hypothetical protein
MRPSSGSSSGAVCQLKITLQDIEPEIWRRVLIRRTTSLARLHEIIQETMGWQNYHLYEFSIRGERFEAPDPEAIGKDATAAKLKDLRLEMGESFQYTYDFGDDWCHEILLEDYLPAEQNRLYPACIGGARACPPEDSGGAGRYAELLQILQNPEDPDFADMMAWVGDDFNPEAFDVQATNRILMLAFGRRAV